MFNKIKLFPALPVVAVAALLASACGAASSGAQPESPCQQECALDFVTCIENCDEDGLCRDACMTERSVCEVECTRPAPTPAIDAGAPLQ